MPVRRGGEGGKHRREMQVPEEEGEEEGEEGDKYIDEDALATRTVHTPPHHTTRITAHHTVHRYRAGFFIRSSSLRRTVRKRISVGEDAVYRFHSGHVPCVYADATKGARRPKGALQARDRPGVPLAYSGPLK